MNINPQSRGPGPIRPRIPVWQRRLGVPDPRPTPYQRPNVQVGFPALQTLPFPPKKLLDLITTAQQKLLREREEILQQAKLQQEKGKSGLLGGFPGASGNQLEKPGLLGARPDGFSGVLPGRQGSGRCSFGAAGPGLNVRGPRPDLNTPCPIGNNPRLPPEMHSFGSSTGPQFSAPNEINARGQSLMPDRENLWRKSQSAFPGLNKSESNSLHELDRDRNIPRIASGGPISDANSKEMSGLMKPNMNVRESVIDRNMPKKMAGPRGFDFGPRGPGMNMTTPRDMPSLRGHGNNLNGPGLDMNIPRGGFGPNGPSLDINAQKDMSGPRGLGLGPSGVDMKINMLGEMQRPRGLGFGSSGPGRDLNTLREMPGSRELGSRGSLMDVNISGSRGLDLGNTNPDRVINMSGVNCNSSDLALGSQREMNPSKDVLGPRGLQFGPRDLLSNNIDRQMNTAQERLGVPIPGPQNQRFLMGPAQLLSSLVVMQRNVENSMLDKARFPENRLGQTNNHFSASAGGNQWDRWRPEVHQ